MSYFLRIERVLLEDQLKTNLFFKGERFQRVVAKNKGKFNKKNEEEILDDDSRPWYRCSFPKFVNYADYIGTFFDHPFIQPLLYDHFHELKNVELYAFTGNNDLLLDHSIELARIWRECGGMQ